MMKDVDHVDHRDLEAVDPQRLDKVMGLGTDETILWEPEELGVILRHQLDARIEEEFTIMGEGVEQEAAELCSSCSPPVATFAQLFSHTSPPVALLKLLKKFARACRDHPDRPLPGKVAAVLYLASIVTARVKCAARISKMDDATLAESIAWAVGLDWLDTSTRGLFNQGLAAIRGGRCSRK